MERILEKIAMILTVFGFEPIETNEKNRMFFMRFKDVQTSAIARNYVLAIARTLGVDYSFSIRYSGPKGMIQKIGEYSCFIPNITGKAWPSQWVLDVYHEDDCVGSFVFFIR